tara:strand:+ start:606 stop:2792 length:2187 start_codon:yes stop_codon:yes gene_type:complete
MSGGGGTQHHHHQNPYDDAWIRDWTTDAEGREEDYIERLRFLEGLGQEQGQSLVDADWQRRLLEQQQQALTGQVGGLETRFDDQAAAFNFGLQGLQAATAGLDAATTGLDLRLTGQADQFNEQLRLAQEGWANTVAAQQAGWDSERAAWNQQQADWGQQYSQQQRQIETQLATEREEYQNQLESIRNVYGVQTQEQRTAWEEQSAQERADFASQLEQYQLEGAEEAEALRQSFAQSQEQQRIADAIQRRDLEAQLSEFGNQYQTDWAVGSQALQSDYQRLIQQASTDAERARLEQARQFERLQMDQAAAYNQRDQELAAQDRVFGTQLDELRRDLGIERDLFGQAQMDFQERQDLLRRTEQERLQQSLGGFQQQLDTGVADIQGQLDRFTGRQLPEGWTRQEPTAEPQMGMGAGGMVQLPDGSWQTGHDFVNQASALAPQYDEKGAIPGTLDKGAPPQRRPGLPDDFSEHGDVGLTVLTNWRNPTTGEVYQSPASNIRPPEGSDWVEVAHGDPDFDRQWEEQRGRYASPLDQKIGSVKQDLTGQIGDIRTDLTGQLGDVKTSLTGDLTKAQQESALARGQLQTAFTGQLGDVRTGLTGQIGDVKTGLTSQIGDVKTGLESQLGQVRQDVTGQLGDFRADIADYKDTLAGQNEAQEAYYAANKRFREMQIQDAERARTAQAYGSPGTTMNQQVKGVRRAGSSRPGGLVRSKTPRNVFNRSGLRISSLNI